MIWVLMYVFIGVCYVYYCRDELGAFESWWSIAALGMMWPLMVMAALVLFVLIWLDIGGGGEDLGEENEE